MQLTDKDEFFCETCVFAMQLKLSFETRVKWETTLGELVYSDVCGPMNEESVDCARYLVLFKDNCSGYRTVNMIKYKSDVLECFNQFVIKCRNKFGSDIKRVRTDNGTGAGRQRLKFLLKGSMSKEEARSRSVPKGRMRPVRPSLLRHHIARWPTP